MISLRLASCRLTPVFSWLSFKPVITNERVTRGRRKEADLSVEFTSETRICLFHSHGVFFLFRKINTNR